VVQINELQLGIQQLDVLEDADIVDHISTLLKMDKVQWEWGIE
jgi:hypothetical protein